jgi:hypothetical protein
MLSPNPKNLLKFRVNASQGFEVRVEFLNQQEVITLNGSESIGIEIDKDERVRVTLLQGKHCTTCDIVRV